MKIESNQKGFTLIELMIVVAIIGILASIAIPQFSAFRTKAFVAASSVDVKNGATLLEAYYIDNYVYPNAIEIAAVKTGSVTMTNGTAALDLTWGLSDGVSAIIPKGTTTATKRCIAAKHQGADKYNSMSTDAPTVIESASVDADVSKTIATITTAYACGI